MIKDYLALSFKNLRRRGLRSWLTLLGIFIGVAAVISLITLGDGLKTAVNSQFGAETTELITVQAGGISGYGPPGTFVSNPLTKEDAEAIGKLATVDIAIPRTIKTVKIEFNNYLQITAAGSIPPESAKDIYDLQSLEAEYGRLLESGDNLKVVLGNNFLDPDKNGFNKEVMPGDSVDIEGKKFRVIGILEREGSFILDNVVLMLESDLNEITHNGDDVSVIIVKVKDKEHIEEAQEDIENLLRERRDVKKGEEDFEVSTPEAMLETVNQILTGVQVFIALIASIAILIGAIGIINTMMTSVLERKKEIGIMKSIGARNSDIFLQFFIEAGLLGMIGGVMGIIFGIIAGSIGVIGINTYIGTQSQPSINFILIFASLLGCFLIGSIAGIAPAMKAARQRPVEVLRD